MNNMIQIGEKTYYIDIDVMAEVLTSEESLKNKRMIETETIKKLGVDGEVISTEIRTKEYDKPKEYDGSKYDVIRIALEVILSYHEEIDDTLGAARGLGKTSVPFKISMNTLIKYGILKEI